VAAVQAPVLALNRAATHTALGLVSARERAANDFFGAAPLALALRSAALLFRRFKSSAKIRSTTRDFRPHSLHPGMLRPGLGNLPSAIRVKHRRESDALGARLAPSRQNL
jgi:hypothetical protein